MSKIRIIVADDHLLIRQGTSCLLEDEEDVECVGMAEDGEQAIKLAKEVLPDVAIIDVAMPKLNGIECTKELKRSCPNTKVLIISAYKRSHYVIAAIEAGADGYLLKDNMPSDGLIGAIRSLHEGRGVFDYKAISAMRNLVISQTKGTTGFADLSSRELECIGHAMKGMTNKEIAAHLGISDQTVGSHFNHIFTKLGVESRAEAVLYALKEGWVDIDDLSIRGRNDSGQ